MQYVYILRSVGEPNRFYVGTTGDLKTRLAAHNAKAVAHTSKFAPWELQTYLGFDDRQKALEFERYLKTGSGRAFAKKQL